MEATDGAKTAKQISKCPNCYSAIGKRVNIKVDGMTVSNTLRRCIVCRKFGCAVCMGHKKSGNHIHHGCE